MRRENQLAPGWAGKGWAGKGWAGKGWAGKGWGLAGILLGTILAFVPLFDLLGYELALALAPFGAAAGLHLGLRRVAKERLRRSRSAEEADDTRPLSTVLRLWASASMASLGVLLGPLAILSVNALRVRNCNVTVGLLWYLVLPCASALYGAALGIGLGVALPRSSGRRAAPAVVLAVLLVAFAWCLLRLYLAPPIFVFDPLFGYFAGSLYDEHVGVPHALWWARAYHATMALALLTSTALWLDGPSLSARRSASAGRWRHALLAALILVAAVRGYTAGPALGYRHDAVSIAAALGGQRETQHFVLHFRPDGPYAPELDWVARELEFRHAELKAELGLEPDRRVHAYLFSSAGEKQALMGAGRTYIAKPWRREIYVNHEAFPQEVLAHELAHVFGAEAGDRILGLPRVGLRLDIGLTEGFAEALTWRGATLTPDEAARLLDVLGRLPSLEAVMSPRFWSLPSQQAYAVAGSFCHHLLRRGGAKKLLALYRRGGAPAAYRELYGEGLASLGAAWLAELRLLPLPEGVVERERTRLLRPSIFRRPCAHELARLVELARGASARGDHPAARAFYEAACAEEPDDPGHLDELLAESARVGDQREVERVAHRLLSHPKVSAGQRAAVHATLGDVQARAHAFLAAAASYARAEAEPTDEGNARLCTVKRVLAARLASLTDAAPARRPLSVVLAVLVQPSSDAAADGLRLVNAARALPDDPLLAYLAARQLFSRGLYQGIDEALAPALRGELPDPRYLREALRLGAEAAFRRRDFAEADHRWQELTRRGSAAGRLDAERWVRRSRYFASIAP